MAQTPLATAKADWMRRFDGAVAYKDVTFGAPTVRHLHKRSYEQLGRNCHFITVFGRVLLGERKIAEAEEGVYKRITEVQTAFERKLKAVNALVAQAGIEDSAEYNKTESIRAAVIVPAQGRFLKTLVLADEYLRQVYTLWLEGEISDAEKSKAELELKHLLRGIASTTRKMRIYLQEKATDAQERAKAEGTRLTAVEKAVADASASDAAPGTDDEDSDESEQVSADSVATAEAEGPEAIAA